MVTFQSTILCSAPARVNILGNPTDALEGAYAVISAAIGLRAYVKLTPGSFNVYYTDEYLGKLDEGREVAKLFLSALYTLKQYFPAFYVQIMKKPFDIHYWTEIPRESGLAGSTALLVAFMHALRTRYNLPINDYILAELVQRAEKNAGVVCGLSLIHI